MLRVSEATFLLSEKPLNYNIIEQIYIGIGVAKDSFVVATRLEGKITTSLYTNDKKGIQGFLKSLSNQTWCIMEATGVYSLQLAVGLYEKGIKVSVVNPLQIKRFAQTKLNRTKTDRVNAALIAEYGERMQPKLYEPLAPFMRQLQQQRMSLKLLVKTKLEKQMQQLAEEHCKDLFVLLQTVPGINKESALELIIVSGAFKNFTSAKQFSAFIGICPCLNESGTSVRGYMGISRIEDKNIRATLYMCSLAAKVYNKGCQQLYERIVAAGKAKKVALAAVMNKLFKQVFGIINSGEAYTSTFMTKC